MVGYDGIESLAFKVLSRILQQADITSVHVHMESSDRSSSSELPSDALHIASSRAQAVEQAKVRAFLTQAAIDPLAKAMPKRSSVQESKVTVPDTNCPVVLRLQPFYEAVLPRDTDLFTEASAGHDAKQSVSFLVWWVDPAYRLSHTTISQAIPAWWCTYATLTQCRSRWSTMPGSSRRCVMQSKAQWRW